MTDTGPEDDAKPSTEEDQTASERAGSDGPARGRDAPEADWLADED